MDRIRLRKLEAEVACWDFPARRYEYAACDHRESVAGAAEWLGNFCVLRLMTFWTWGVAVAARRGQNVMKHSRVIIQGSKYSKLRTIQFGRLSAHYGIMN